MEINLNRGFKNIIEKFNVSSFIKQLEERLKKMEKERELVVDRFEENYAVCEDRNTKEIVNIELNKLPSGILEGTVIKYENGKYIVDTKSQEEISDRIKNKMDDLWE